MQQQRDQPEPMGTREAANYAAGAALLLALYFLPFFRTGQGTRAYHPAGYTLLGLLVLGGLCPPLLALLPPWVVMLAWRRFWADRHAHSLYLGRSVFTRVGFSDRAAERVVEPMLLFWGGIALLPWSEPVGGFVWAGSFALWVAQGVRSLAHEAKVRYWRDRRAEAEREAAYARGDYDH